MVRGATQTHTGHVFRSGRGQVRSAVPVPVPTFLSLSLSLSPCVTRSSCATAGSVDLDEFITMVAVRTPPNPNHGERPRSASSLLLAAAEELRLHVVAVYGVENRTEGMRQQEERRAREADERCCFFLGTPGGDIVL